MKHHKFLILGLIITLQPYHLFSDLIDFNTAFQRVYCYSPKLQEAALEVKIKGSEKLQASLFPNPALEFESENCCGSGHFRSWDAAELTVTAFQTIELGGKCSARTALARTNQSIALWNYEIVKSNLLLDLRNAFIKVAENQHLLKLLEEKFNIATEIHEIICTKVENGKVPKMDELKSRINLQSIKLELQSAKIKLNEALKNLSLLWGCAEPDFDGVKFDLFFIETPPCLCTYQHQMNCSPDIKVNELEVKLAKKEYDLQYSNAVPDLTLGAGYRKNREEDDHSLRLVAFFPIPIFDQNQGNIRRSKQEICKERILSSAEYAQQMKKLEVAYENWLTSYQTAKSIETGILNEATEAFKLTSEGFEQGKFEYLYHLESQQTLFDIRENQISVLADYHRHKAEVERLSGIN